MTLNEISNTEIDAKTSIQLAFVLTYIGILLSMMIFLGTSNVGETPDKYNVYKTEILK